MTQTEVQGVQSDGFPPSGGSHITQAYGSNNTANNLLVYGIQTTTTITSVTDTAGNSILGPIATSGPDPGSASKFFIYYVKAAKSGANSVTVNFPSTPTFGRLCIYEFNDSNGSPNGWIADLTGTASGDNASAATVTIILGTNAQANEVIVGFNGCDGSLSAGTGFTNSPAVAAYPGVNEFKFVTSQASQTCTFNSVQGNYAAASATFMVVASATKPTSVPIWFKAFSYNDAADFMFPVAPQRDSGAIQLTNTQKQFFGQHGQAPTKRWSPHLTIDDPAVHMTPVPEQKNSAVIQLLTNTHFFGALGQVPTKNWASTYDDPPAWQVTLDDLNMSNPIRAVASATPYIITPGGTWVWSYLQDDTAGWYTRPAPRHFFAFLAAPAQPSFFSTYDDTPPWLPVIPNMPGAIFTPQVAHPNITPRWFSSYDDTPPWAPAIDNENIPGTILGQLSSTSPVITRWFNSYDETPPWVRTIQRAIQARPFTFVPRSSYDDTSAWVATIRPNGAIVTTATQTTFYGQAGQGYPFRWNATYDDASTRLIVPVGANEGLFATLIPPPPFANLRPLWRSDNDPPPWQRTAPNSQAITLTTTQIAFYGQAGQGYPFRWNATLDDPSVWTWPPQGQNKSLNVTAAPFLHTLPWFYSEDAFWQGAPRAPIAVKQAPFLHAPPQFYSEDAFWQGSPRQFVPVPATNLRPFRPNFTQDDSSVWTWPAQLSHAIVLTTTQASIYGKPGQTIPHFWRNDYDDYAVWRAPSIMALSNYIIIKPPAPPANVSYALVTVTVAYSESALGNFASMSRASPSTSGTQGSSNTSISISGNSGSSSEVD